MEQTRLSSKGQVIIPKSVRTSKGLQTGDVFFVEEYGSAILLIPARPFVETEVAQAFGCLEHKGPPLSLEEMEAGIAKGARIASES